MITFKKIANKNGWNVFLNNTRIGKLRVEKFGWDNHGVVGGVPSQVWTFYYATEEGKAIQGITGVKFDYIKDAKKAIIAAYKHPDNTQHA